MECKGFVVNRCAPSWVDKITAIGHCVHLPRFRFSLLPILSLYHYDPDDVLFPYAVSQPS